MRLTNNEISEINQRVIYLVNQVNYLTQPNEQKEREHCKYMLACIADSFSDYTAMTDKNRRLMHSIKDTCMRVSSK